MVRFRQQQLDITFTLIALIDYLKFQKFSIKNSFIFKTKLKF